MAKQKKEANQPLVNGLDRNEWQQWADLERRLAFDEKTTREEKRLHARLSAKRDQSLFEKSIEAVPKKVWSFWSARDTRVLIDQSTRYGIPTNGPTISLPAIARWAHNFLAQHGRKISESEGGAAVSAPLERGRTARTEMEELRLARERRTVVDVSLVRSALQVVAAVYRKGGDKFKRQFSREVNEAFAKCQADAEAKIEDFFNSLNGDADGSS